MNIEIPIEELRKGKIFLACPMYGGQNAGMFARSVADLSAACTHHGIQLQIYFLFNESLITRARNYCCDEFIRSDATHLMFIDSDIGFNAQDVLGLLALSLKNEEYDVIAGPYPKKCISWEKIKVAVDKGFADENPNNLDRYVGDYVFNPKSGSERISINEPVEVREAGTGFMMVRKETLLKYRDFYPQQSYRPDHIRTEHFDGSRPIHAFFDCIIDRGYTIDEAHNLVNNLATQNFDFSDIESVKKVLGEMQKVAQGFMEAEKTASRRYLSEDYMFCYNVQKMGGKVWFCPWMKLQHVGSYVFGGSLADLAQIGAAATADASLLKKNRRNDSPAVAQQEQKQLEVPEAVKKAEEKRKKKAEKNAKKENGTGDDSGNSQSN